MGYESKLYIVDVMDSFVDKKGFKNTITIATIDLCKVGIPLDKFFAKDSGCSISYGNKEKRKDCYGDRLKTCTDLPGFIAWMEEEARKGYYRRWGMAIALLKAIKPEDWGNIQVLHFGH